jgi:hypothetical protein
MKRSIAIVVLICAGLSVCAQSTKAQTPRFRYADSIPNFLIFGQRGIDNWGDRTRDTLMPIGARNEPYNQYRYTYNPTDTTLSYNLLTSGSFDYPDWWPKNNLILTGKFNPPYLQTGSARLSWVINNSSNLRFECERHPVRDDALEYTGYRTRSGLVGVNAFDAQGTMPRYLKISSTTSIDT